MEGDVSGKIVTIFLRIKEITKFYTEIPDRTFCPSRDTRSILIFSPQQKIIESVVMSTGDRKFEFSRVYIRRLSSGVYKG